LTAFFKVRIITFRTRETGSFLYREDQHLRPALIKSVQKRVNRSRCSPVVLGFIASGLALAALCGIPFRGVDVAAAQGEPPVKSLLELRTHGVIVQQFDLSCGAATLATVLNFQFSDRVTEKQVAQGLMRRREYVEHPELVRARQGFSLLDLKHYVDNRGYRGVGYGKLELKDLMRLAPVIVAVSPIGYNHFVVFRGQLGGQVLLADPAFGNESMSVDKFQRIWINFPAVGRVGFIVTKNGRPASPGQLGLQASQLVAPPASIVRHVALPF